MIISFTGHRPSNPYLGGYDLYSPRNIQIKNTTKKAILYLMNYFENEEVYHFITGGALGFDQIAAGVILELKKELPNKNIVLECAVPFKYQYANWRNQIDINRYNMQLASSDIVTYVDRTIGYNLDKKTAVDYYSAYKMQLRNQYMVDKLREGNNNVLIALYDKKNTRCGTYNCIQYALKFNIKILYI